MRDLFKEIRESIGRNKLRTCLTGFAVSWGLFMLIVLLGAGRGISNSFNEDVDSNSVNVMEIFGGWTSKPYNGMKEGRRVPLEEQDISVVSSPAFSDKVDEVSAVLSVSETVSRGNRHFSGQIEGSYPARIEMDHMNLLKGRFINDSDIQQQRKVLVLSDVLAELLLEPQESTEKLIGRQIKVGGTAFTICGITKERHNNNSKICYAPYSTLKTIYSKGKELGKLSFTFHGIGSEEESEQFENSLRASLNRRHNVSPDDKRAFWIWNTFIQSLQMNRGGRILNTALWIIGLFTLLGGIVGVSNIMLITVKERTHEFGIRKAIGASPASITKLIIAESVSITAVFGYIGMLLGIIGCDILGKVVGGNGAQIMGESVKIMVNPGVDLGTAVAATLVMIGAGVVAGLIPAVKAAKVKPIEALRAE